MQAEHLEVVADVADHGELARREHVVEPGRELRAADAAGEEDDLHDARRSSAIDARVRAPARGASRSRSASVSTSSLEARELETVEASPSAAACARNRAALPGP